MTEQPMGTQDQSESFVASEGTPEAQAPNVEQSSAPEQSSGGHPAWQEILESVPEMFHPNVRPTLEKWDKGVQEKLEAERQQWADYQFIRDNKLTPDTIQYALNMLGSLQNDPRAFYDQMGKHYNFVQEQQAQAQTPDEYDFSEYGDESQQAQTNPEVAQLRQQMEQMAQLLYAQQQKEQQAQEDAALEKELAGLRQKYGEYDENYVLGLMANGQDGESAVRAYKELESKLRGNSNGQATAPPRVMGTGGAAPASGAVDPKKLDAKGRKTLAIQMLEAQQRLGA